MKVVSNSTALVHLSAIGQLDILRQRFGEIYIPEGVYHEVVVAGAGKPGAVEVAQAAWIHTATVTDKTALALLRSVLGAGEAESIVLALEMSADLIILDDKAARQFALAQGLRVSGTIGVLLEAGKRGEIDFVFAMEQLLATGFRLHPREYQRILDLWQASQEESS